MRVGETYRFARMLSHVRSCVGTDLAGVIGMVSMLPVTALPLRDKP
jgi:hypothetical protein